MTTKAQIIDFLLNQIRDNTQALIGGTVTFYAAGTTTLKNVYTDRNKTTIAPNPYTLDADGTAQLYGDGLYRIVIKTAAGVTRFDRDNLNYRDYTQGSSGIDGIVYADATLGDITVTLPDVGTNISVIRTDDTANIVEILPPVGSSFVEPGQVFLYQKNEMISFVSSGLLYYRVSGNSVLPVNNVITIHAAATDVIDLALDATPGPIVANIANGTVEVIAIRIDATINSVTIMPPPGFTINGSASYALTNEGETVHLLLSGSNYYSI